MLKKITKTTIVLLAVLIVLSGCSKKNTFIGYDITLNTKNLDPQFYTDKTAEMIIVNTFEGLVVKDSRGQLYPAAADSWQVSSDGLVYTFELGNDSYWEETGYNKKTKVSADDFVFAFHRIFSPEATSPYAGEYLQIKNASKVLEGKVKIEELGVYAQEPLKLVIELENPDSNFLLKLARPAATPCNKEFFLGTRGRYGLNKNLILGNGPFVVSRWEDNRITLSKNSEYAQQKNVMVDSIDLYVVRENTYERFKDGRTDIIKISQSQIKDYKSSKYILSEFDDTLWCLAFNVKSDYWSSIYFRSATFYGLNKEKLNISKDSPFTPTNTVFSPSIKIDGALVSNYGENNVEYSPQKAKDNYQTGLDIADIRQIPVANIYIPQGEHKDILAPIQEDWKETFNLYYSFTEVPRDDLDVKIRAKDFDIVLLPISAIATIPEQVLEQFTSASKQNYVNYENTTYDVSYSKLIEATTSENYGKAAVAAEKKLFDDKIIVPLYTEQGYYVLTKAAQDVDIYFGENIIRFHKLENI